METNNENISKKFTTNLKNAIAAAHDLAMETKHAWVNPEHLIFGLLITSGSLSSEVLNKFKINPETLRANIIQINPKSGGDFIPRPSETVKQTIQRAVLIAHTFSHQYIGTEHLLAAIVDMNDPRLTDLWRNFQVDTTTLKQQISLILRSTSKFPDITNSFGPTGNELLNGEDNPDELEKMFAAPMFNDKKLGLGLFTTNLTDSKIQNDIDPVIGREEEIQRLIQVLGRRNKNNPVLLGDPGVGKTAIVEGLAKKIIQGEVPDILLNKKILNLDLGLVLAGTMYRGEFEQRLKNIISEVTRDTEVILFIDEIHTIVGAGATGGSLDAANILKPALARGELRCIGATTLTEYRKHIENDPALERRFAPIIVEEPTIEKTEKILLGIKKNYEKFHRVMIAADAITAAVRLSKRYIQDRFLPDKAIDLIDEAAAKIKVNQKSDGLIKKIRDTEKGLDLLLKNKREAILGGNYIEAIEIKKQEQNVRHDLAELKKDQEKKSQKTIGKISEKNIAEIVAHMTGIPLSELSSEGEDVVRRLFPILKRKIIGQDEAVRTIATAIRRARTGVSSEKRPLGSFIFLGPSGVGKTELAKVLAGELFSDKDALVRIDMSEFKESFNVSKLIGAPAGYVGYKEGNILTDAVRRKPYSVVLFDEIEKAHPEVFNLLLQILEDGQLTDATGKKVNFKNTIIIMTSNVGLKDFVAQKNIGFGDISRDENLYDEMKGYLEKSLADRFRPEFLNRVDRVVSFRPLDLSDLERIVKLQLEELNERLKTKKLDIKVDAKAIKFLASKNYDPQQGARTVRRNLTEFIEDPLSQALLEQKFRKSDIIKMVVKDGRVVLKN